MAPGIFLFIERRGESVEEIRHTQLRIASGLWKAVRHEAVEEGVSANKMIILLISEALEARRALSRSAPPRTV